MQESKSRDDGVVEAISGLISNYTVGFLRLMTDERGAEDSVSAGSGALVRVGSVFGILTAAHVLDNLPSRGFVGLARFPGRSVIQNHRIDMGLTEKITIGADNARLGPDIGFLRLPPNSVSALGATNVFSNLGMRREAALKSPRLTSLPFCAIVGVVAERLRDLTPIRPKTRLKGVEGLFGAGKVVREYESGGFDFCDFEVSFETAAEIPNSYQGMSGGVLWSIEIVDLADGRIQVNDRMIVGVAYHESDPATEPRVITCHGSKSIYDALIGRIRARWPDQSAPEFEIRSLVTSPVS